MRKISGIVDKSDTDNGFSNEEVFFFNKDEISFVIQRKSLSGDDNIYIYIYIYIVIHSFVLSELIKASNHLATRSH